MTPFAAFRIWARRGPAVERVLAALSALLALALLSWLAVPVGNDPNSFIDAVTADVADGAAARSGAAGTPSEGSTAAPLDGSEAGSVPSSGGATGDGRASVANPTPGAASAVAAACRDLGATAPGVTKDSIKIALTIVDLAGPVGNATFGVPSNLPESVKAIVDGINAAGGAACRTIKYDIYKVNPIDQNAQRAACLDIAASDAFAVVDYAGFVSEAGQACFPEQHVPYLGLTSMTEAFVAKAFPFAFSPVASTDRQLHNLALGLGERKILQTPGFTKLGVFISSCYPDINRRFRDDLHRIGIPDDKISWFTGTCELVNPPSQVSQAVAQHRGDGVSHVLFGTSIASSQNYVRSASGIGFRPQYIVGDFGSNTQGASGWSADFDNAIAITSLRAGELNSGIPNAVTDTCQRWFEQAGMARQDEGGGGLVMCDLLRLFDAAADAAGPRLTRTTLVPSLPRLKNFASSVLGDAVFGPNKYWGGDFTRRIDYDAQCPCWKTSEPRVRPAPS